MPRLPRLLPRLAAPSARAKERIAATLLSAHNLTFYAGLMARMREAIAADRFAEFHEENRRRWRSKGTVG